MTACTTVLLTVWSTRAQTHSVALSTTRVSAMKLTMRWSTRGRSIRSSSVSIDNKNTERTETANRVLAGDIFLNELIGEFIRIDTVFLET